MATGAVRRTIGIDLDRGPCLSGELTIPDRANGLVIFALENRSSRFNLRDRSLAGKLEHAGFATLLLDLLTKQEERGEEFAGRHFDVPLLAARLIETTDWAVGLSEVRSLPIAYYGASVNAAAALIAASERPEAVRAVVCRSGRPDLAGTSLLHVKAPTLLMVGSEDRAIYDLNWRAAASMSAPIEIVVLPGVGHEFEEPGAINQAAALACAWLGDWLPDDVPYMNADLRRAKKQASGGNGHASRH
jgi:putative phosphoribosyl transferase